VNIAVCVYVCGGGGGWFICLRPKIRVSINLQTNAIVRWHFLLRQLHETVKRNGYSCNDQVRFPVTELEELNFNTNSQTVPRREDITGFKPAWKISFTSGTISLFWPFERNALYTAPTIITKMNTGHISETCRLQNSVSALVTKLTTEGPCFGYIKQLQHCGREALDQNQHPF
jgi:hypothetical protein